MLRGTFAGLLLLLTFTLIYLFFDHYQYDKNLK